MRLAGFELRKLLCQKSLVVIFVICAMVNLLLLSFQGAGSYTPGMYLALMEDLSGMTAEDASDMMSVSIFRESAGFSTRNIEKTAEDFAGLSDIDPVPDVSAGVVMAAGQDATDFIMVFFLAALSVFLVMGEKQAGLLMLTAPTERGRQRTAAAKMAAMAVVMVIAMAVLYGENFILAAERYGFGDLSRPSSPWEITRAVSWRFPWGSFLSCILPGSCCCTWYSV